MGCTKNDELIIKDLEGKLTLYDSLRLNWILEDFMEASEKVIQANIKDESDRETLRKALRKAITEKIRESFVLQIPKDKKEE